MVDCEDDTITICREDFIDCIITTQEVKILDSLVVQQKKQIELKDVSIKTYESLVIQKDHVIAKDLELIKGYEDDRKKQKKKLLLFSGGGASIGILVGLLVGLLAH